MSLVITLRGPAHNAGLQVTPSALRQFISSRPQTTRGSFFGQVDAVASAAPACTQQEGSHNHVQHDAPQALQPPRADEKKPGARANHPAMDPGNRKQLSSCEIMNRTQHCIEIGCNQKRALLWLSTLPSFQNTQFHDCVGTVC